MGEPQKPIMRRDKGRSGDNKIHDKITTDTTTTRAGDSNSLIREISIRNNKDDSGQSAVP